MPAAATLDDFEALLNESFELETPEEGTVVKGTVLAIEAGQAIIDIGYKMEGRVDLKEFTAAGGKAAEIAVGDIVEVYPRPRRERPRRGGPQPREGPPRRSLGPSREGLREGRAGRGRDLRPRQGRLHRRPRRRRGLPAGHPGRRAPGARRRPADAHAAALPDPEDGPPPRQHRRLAPRGPGREPAPSSAPRSSRGWPRATSSTAWSRTSPSTAPSSTSAASTACCTSPTWRGGASTTRAEILGDRRDRQGPGHQDQQGHPAHQPRHEAAAGRSVGHRRGEVPDRLASTPAASPTSPTTAPSWSWSRGSRAWCTSRRCPGPRRTSIPARSSPPRQEVEVVVLEIDGQKRRVSLGLKQTQGNPWETFVGHPSERHRGRGRGQEHHRVRPLRRPRRRHRRHGPPLATSTGTARARKRSSDYHKGDMVKAVVTDVDVEKERISLSIKQLGGDPFAEAVAGVKRGDIVTVTVTSIEDGGIEVEYDGDEDLHPPVRPQPRPLRAAPRALHQGRPGRRPGDARSTPRPASSASRSRRARSPRRRKPSSSTARPTPAPRSATSWARR